MSRDSRSPTLAPVTLPSEIPSEISLAAPDLESTTMSAVAPSAPRSTAEMQAEIGSLLDETTRRNFVNTINLITRLGNKKPKMVEPRRKKLRDIVTANTQILQLYNVYANAQVATEKRVTFRLPVFGDVELDEERELPVATDGQLVQELNKERNEFEHDPKPVEPPHEPKNEQDHSVQRTGPAQNEGAETQQENHDRPDTPEGPIVGAIIPDQDIDYAQERDVDMQEESLDAIDAHKREQSETTSSIHQESEPVEDKDTDMLEATDSTTTTPLDVDPDNHLPGAVDVTEVAQDEAAAQSSPTQQISYPPRTSEYPINLVNTSRPIAGKVVETVFWAVGQTNQAPNPLSKVYPSVTPVRNPGAFPIDRLQCVQAQYYPSAKVVSVCTHRDSNNVVVRVTADLQNGPVNHFIIDDARIITGLGLREGGHDIIFLNKASFKPDETFTFDIIYGQHARNLDAFVVGRLQSARHAYLYWLDLRGSADPKYGPSVAEARHLAKQLGRRASDVWSEIDSYWQYEAVGCGRKFRDNRLDNLGEDPVYDATVKTSFKVRVLSMW